MSEEGKSVACSIQIPWTFDFIKSFKYAGSQTAAVALLYIVGEMQFHMRGLSSVTSLWIN